MAISSDAVWEVRSTATASNANGGFYKTGSSGTDYSQQNAAQYNLTGCTSSAANAIILNANAAADMVGNGLKVVSGTNATVGWYEIISVVAGVSITVDRNWCTAAASVGVVNVGGALSLGSSDDAVFEAMEPGNIMYIKTGTYTIGGTVNIAKDGGLLAHRIHGYQTTRGDTPTTANRPTLDFGTTTFTTGTTKEFKNINFVGTAASLMTQGSGCRIINCRLINKSTTVARVAVTSGNTSYIENCEIISYRGYAISNAGVTQIHSSWIHSSDVGIRFGAAVGSFITDTIIESNVTAAVEFAVAYTVGIGATFKNCTLFGSTNTTGTGVRVTTTGSYGIRVVNCIISGFVTGLSHVDAGQLACYESTCSYYNNDTDVTNWTKSATSVATNPTFTSVGQVTGTAATTSGSVLTDGAKDFTALGVVAGRDYIRLVSGTGITAGIYGITTVGTTTLTLDIAPGTSATADKVYEITIGKNFSVNSNMKALGNSAVGAGSTPNYVDLGAAQRQGGTSTDPGVANVATGTNYTIDDVAKVGTLAASAGIGGYSSGG